MKIIEIFNGNRFMIPQNKEELNKNIIDLQQKIFDEKTNLKKIETTIKEIFKNKLGEDGVPGKYDFYILYFIQEKLIYENLNKCKLQNDNLIGEIWVPDNKFSLLNSTLNKISLKENNSYRQYKEHLCVSYVPPTNAVYYNTFYYLCRVLRNIKKYSNTNHAYK